jgi:hypothetical protein
MVTAASLRIREFQDAPIYELLCTFTVRSEIFSYLKFVSPYIIVQFK